MLKARKMTVWLIAGVGTFEKLRNIFVLLSMGGGGNSQGESANLLFGKFFTENCMKIKEIGPGARP